MGGKTAHGKVLNDISNQGNANLNKIWHHLLEKLLGRRQNSGTFTHRWWGCKLCSYYTLENMWAVSYETKYDSAVPLVDSYQTEMKTCVHTQIFAQMWTVALSVTAQAWNYSNVHQLLNE